MNDFSAAILAIVGGAFALATISVILSRNAQTSAVLQAGGSALSAVIGAAVNPITLNNPTSLGNSTFASYNDPAAALNVASSLGLF